MQFQPKTPEELKRESLLDSGLYNFQVIKAEEKVSKSGNDMIALTLEVYADDKGTRSLKDWLMPSMGFKLRHFAETTGLLGAYDTGTLTAEDCVGRSGKVYVIIKDSEQYGPQNSVKDYEKAVKKSESALAEQVQSKTVRHIPAPGSVDDPNRPPF